MKKIALVTSKGGHLFQMDLLKEFWIKHDHFWVTFGSKEVEQQLKNEHLYFAYYPESRNLVNAFRNFFLAFRILRKEHPEFVISAGAGIAPPFFLASKILHIKTIFIEPFDFIAFPSLSGKICYQIADFFFVQHPEQLKFYPKAIFLGALL